MPMTEKVNEDHRRHMIAEAAYFRAEQRGFRGGDRVADWLEAEAEIDARLRGGDPEPLAVGHEKRLEAANERLRTFRRKIAEASAEARDEWVRDVENLTKLRDRLRRRVKEIRERGQDASGNARLQAEKIWEEISELVDRASSRRSQDRRPR